MLLCKQVSQKIFKKLAAILITFISKTIAKIKAESIAIALAMISRFRILIFDVNDLD